MLAVHQSSVLSPTTCTCSWWTCFRCSQGCHHICNLPAGNPLPYCRWSGRSSVTKFHLHSGGRGSLRQGRLGVQGQVWEFRFLPSFPSFPRENRSFKKCLGKGLEVPDTLLPDIRGLHLHVRGAESECRSESEPEICFGLYALYAQLGSSPVLGSPGEWLCPQGVAGSKCPVTTHPPSSFSSRFKGSTFVSHTHDRCSKPSFDQNNHY